MEDKMEKAFEVYLKNQSFVKTLSRRYSKIDPAISYEDLLTEGYIAVMNALDSFDSQTNLSFSSHLWWHLQKRFQSVLGTDKVVEVKHVEGRQEIISYSEFIRVKRSLPEGTEWRVTSLLSSFEELTEKMGDGEI
jgi:DNA-directed RNA polymerase sigma subunit (sigma70/sigma32)